MRHVCSHWVPSERSDDYHHRFMVLSLIRFDGHPPAGVLPRRDVRSWRAWEGSPGRAVRSLRSSRRRSSSCASAGPVARSSHQGFRPDRDRGAGVWVKQAERDAGTWDDGGLTSDERTELAQLRRENRRLKTPPGPRPHMLLPAKTGRLQRSAAVVLGYCEERSKTGG